MRGIARDGEHLDHAVGHGVGGLRARRLVLVEPRDLLAVLAEAEARQELDVVVAHAADVEADDLLRHRRAAGAAQRERGRERRRHDLRRVAADARGSGCDPGSPLGELVVRPERRDPAVRALADLLDGLLLQGSHVDGDGRAERLHLQLERAVLRERRPRVALLLPRQERARDLDDVLHLRERLVERSPVKAFDDVLAARTDAEDEPPLADLVERRRRHRDEAGRAAEDVDDPRAELDALGVNGHLREEREDLVPPGLGDPEGMVAELVGELRGAHVHLAVVVLPEGEEGDRFGHRGQARVAGPAPGRRRRERVYRALDPRLGRSVALKVMLAEGASETARAPVADGRRSHERGPAARVVDRRGPWSRRGASRRAGPSRHQARQRDDHDRWGREGARLRYRAKERARQETTYFDASDRPTHDRHGVHAVKFEYGESGKRIGKTELDEKGKVVAAPLPSPKR